MARKKFDDLDEMRKDLDELGTALGIQPKGKAKRRKVKSERVAGAQVEPAPQERRAEPGEVLRGHMRKALGVAGLALAIFAQAGHARDERRETALDSLRALRVVISSEFKAGDAVLEIHNSRKADSLLRNVPSRGPLIEAIRDTGLAREMRTRAEFDAYWDKLEASPGHRALRGNLAAQDVDKTRIRKAYLFDSSVVVFPGWIVIRKRAR